MRELQQLGPENIVIAVCGNKCDLEDKRVRANMMPAAASRTRLYLPEGCVAYLPSSHPLTCAYYFPVLFLSASRYTQEVDASEARAYAEEIGALFMETSAKANRNVQELFVGEWPTASRYEVAFPNL